MTGPIRAELASEGSSPKSSSKSGFTLVELLVALYLSLIVASMAFGLYRQHSFQLLKEDALLRQRRSLWSAMEILARELRMAGNGLSAPHPAVKKVQAWTPSRPYEVSGRTGISASPGWFHHSDTFDEGFRAIFGIDGESVHADSVTIFRSELELPTPVGYARSFSYERIELVEAARAGTAAAGDVIMVSKEGRAFLLELSGVSGRFLVFRPYGRFSSGGGARWKPDELMGAAIHNLRDAALITYYVDEEKSRLMAAHHAQSRTGYDDKRSKSVVVADGIEDMQLFYFFKNDKVELKQTSESPGLSSKLLDEAPVKAVALAMTSRADRGAGPMTRFRPALFNRRAGTGLDDRTRLTATELVGLRNM